MFGAVAVRKMQFVCTGPKVLLTLIVAVSLLDGSTVAQEENDDVIPHPVEQVLHTMEIKIESVYRTVVKTDRVTVTDYPTCTATVSGIVPCQLLQVARTQRALMTQYEHHPRNLSPSLIALIKEITRSEVAEREEEILSGKSNFPIYEEGAEGLEPSSPLFPEDRVIIVRLTTTVSSVVTKTVKNTETTVGITYSGCIPSNAPKTTACP